MAITSTQQTDILKVVAGLFNAAPGGNYLTEMANLVEGGMTISQLADALAAHTLFTGTVMAGKVTTAAQVAVLMDNFGLAVGNTDATSADAQAEAYFTSQIDAGVGFGQIVYDAVTFLSTTTDTAFTTTATLLANKALVATTYSESASSTNLSTLQNVLSNVTGTAAYTQADVDAVLEGSDSTPTVGQTFTLTTAVETLTSTSNDTVNGVDTGTAASSTFNTGDKISAAKDVNITFSGNGTVAADVDNAATFSGTMLAAATINAALFDSVATIQSAGGGVGSVLTVTNGPLASTYGVKNEVSAGGISVGLRTADISGSADAIKFSVNGVGAQTGSVASGKTTTNVGLTSSTTGVEKISVATAGTNYFSATGSTTATTDGKTLEITGSGNNTITATALTQATLFDMSASTGTNELTAPLASSITIKGGTGADTLKVSPTTTYGSVTVTGVETLSLGTGSNTGQIVFASAPNFTTVEVNGDAAEAGVYTLNSAGTITNLNYVGSGTTALSGGAQQFNSLTLSNSLSGTSDTLAVGFNNKGTALASGIGFTTNGTTTLSGAEIVNITVSDVTATGALNLGTGLTDANLTTLKVVTPGIVTLGTLTATNTTTLAGGLSSLDLSGVAGSGVSSVTIGNNTISAATVVTAAAGGTTFTAANAEAAGDSILYTGAAGVDTVALTGFLGTSVIDGKEGSDVIAGGSGTDTITGGEGADTISSAIGADSIVLTETVASADVVVFGNASTVTGGADIAFGALGGADTITGFGSTDDLRFDISAFGLAGGTEYVGAIGALTVDSSDEIVVLTGAGYATDELAEDAIAARVTTDGSDMVFVYFNTGDNTAHIVHDTDAGVDGAGTTTLIGTISNYNTQALVDTLTVANISSFA